jgi:hypothetical protein
MLQLRFSRIYKPHLLSSHLPFCLHINSYMCQRWFVAAAWKKDAKSTTLSSALWCTFSTPWKMYVLNQLKIILYFNASALSITNSSYSIIRIFRRLCHLSIDLSFYPVFHVPSFLSQSSSSYPPSPSFFFHPLFPLYLYLFLFLFLYWPFRRPNGLTSLLHFYSRINFFSGHLTAR